MGNKEYLLLAINPGSTSTKIALFRNEELLMSKNLFHEPGSLPAEVQQQLTIREDTVLAALREAGYEPEQVDAFVGRGGGIVNVPCGTYRINELFIRHASVGMLGVHPAQLAPQIAARLAKRFGGEAFTVNPPDSDEFCEEARFTGIRGVYRASQTHALNQKEMALRYCAANGLRYEDVNLVLIHMGGGISVTAHRLGKMVDSNSILTGDGPMTPTRCGTVPAASIAKLCYSGKYTQKEILNKTRSTGGLLDWLGTTDCIEIEQRITDGDELARQVYDAMIYQIACSVYARFAPLHGKVDQVICTGGMAHSRYIIDKLKEYIEPAVPVTVMAGEFEMEALAAGALRVLRGEEQPKEYTAEPVWVTPVEPIL